MNKHRDDETLETKAREILKKDDMLYSGPFVRELARSYLEEMDKPKVWNKAPAWADQANISFHITGGKTNNIVVSVYTRELPKSRARVIAEEERERLTKTPGTMLDLADFIEAGILRREAELRGES